MTRDEQAIEHETAFVKSFIIRERRERYLTRLASRKHRRMFLGRLNHQLHKDLVTRFITHGTRTWPNNKSMCYILADEVEFDDKMLSSSEAEDAVSAAYFGIVVSFVPGKLACYKDEAPSELVWLVRE